MTSSVFWRTSWGSNRGSWCNSNFFLLTLDTLYLDTAGKMKIITFISLMLQTMSASFHGKLTYINSASVLIMIMK